MEATCFARSRSEMVFVSKDLRIITVTKTSQYPLIVCPALSKDNEASLCTHNYVTHICTNAHTCTHAQTHTHSHTHIHTHTHTHTHMHTRTNTHTHTHTHTHTQTHILQSPKNMPMCNELMWLLKERGRRIFES